MKTDLEPVLSKYDRVILSAQTREELVTLEFNCLVTEYMKAMLSNSSLLHIRDEDLIQEAIKLASKTLTALQPKK